MANSYKTADITVGDTVILQFVSEHTEHEVTKVVGDMLQIKPKHPYFGAWTEIRRVAALVKPQEIYTAQTPHNPEIQILTNIPERLPFFKALLAKLL